MKNRPIISIIIILVLLAAAAYLLLRRANRLPSQQAQSDTSLNFSDVIPADWTILSDYQLQCDFDGDNEQEWLIVYRYDQTTVEQPYPNVGTTTSISPIGAAIFDAQNNPVPPDSGNPSVYQPTMVIPYRLLPDFYTGKGQGYLGESNINIVYNPPLVKGKACQTSEITVLGYAGGVLPTRLSIFRWQDPQTGYIAEHFIGDERITPNIPKNGDSPVTQVTTYNRLGNHRSMLCAVRTYNRDTSQPLHFDENEAAYTIDFCFNSPADPTYPEGVVVSYLRGNKPQPRSDDAPVVPSSGYLLNGVAVPAGVEVGPNTRIVMLANPATVGSESTGGEVCTTQINTPEARGNNTPTPEQGWICGRVTATVETEVIFAPNQLRRVRWELMSLNPEQVNGDVHWRISNIEVVSAP